MKKHIIQSYIVALVLAETTTAQPEADTVERAARAVASWSDGEGQGPHYLCDALGQPTGAARHVARAALAAAQPEADARCDGSGLCRAPVHIHGCWADTGLCEDPDHWEGPAREPVPPLLTLHEDGTVTREPVTQDDREALGRLLWERRGGSIRGGRSWDDPTIFTESVKESWRQEADVILAAGFRRSRPEATHTVTAERVDELLRRTRVSHLYYDPFYYAEYDGPEEWYDDEDTMLADADNYGADDKGGFEWLSKST